MSDRIKHRTMPYLPRYQPLLSSVSIPSRRNRYPYPGTMSKSREFIYYINGRPARVINSYHGANFPPHNKASRIFVSSPSLGHYLSRDRGNTSFDDVSASHVYTNPGELQDGSSRHRNDDMTDDCQDICQSSSCCLDVTPSESGVSVGESGDWSIFGHEIDNISQHSSNSWSTFCEVNGDSDIDRHDIDRHDIDTFNGSDFLGDGSHDFHYSCNDDKKSLNEIREDDIPYHESKNPQKTFSNSEYVGETLSNVSPRWHNEHVNCSNLESQPEVCHESLSNRSGQITEQATGTGYREVWQSEPHKSVVCDTSYFSVTQSVKIDSCKNLLDLDILKYETKRGDLGCNNEPSENDSDFLGLPISSFSGEVAVTTACDNREVTTACGNREVTTTCDNREVTTACDNREVTTACDNREMTTTCDNREVTTEKMATVSQNITEYFSDTSSKNQLTLTDETLLEGDSVFGALHAGSTSESSREHTIRCKVGQHMPDDDSGVNKLTQQVYLQTDRLVNSETNENQNSVKSNENDVSLTVPPTNKRDMIEDDFGILSGGDLDFQGDSHTGFDLSCSSNMSDDDVFALSVSDNNMLQNVAHRVDSGPVRYKTTIGYANLTKYACLERGECFEDIHNANSAYLLLPPDTVSNQDVNTWDLPPETVCNDDVNRWDLSGETFIPKSQVIDCASESSVVRAEQTPLEQSCVRHRVTTPSHRRINSNKRAENLIDSSQADAERLRKLGGFWEETQSSETVSRKTERSVNKNTNDNIDTDPDHTLLDGQKISRVTQQLTSPFVISFDSCDTFGKFYFCVYCGKRTKTCTYGVVCAHCLFQLHNNSISDEKVINYCYRREDIDPCAGIPASILDESIKHADVKLRTNKGSQHVGRFCAESRGVGCGNIDEIRRDDRASGQAVNKSTSRQKGRHAVDYHSTWGTETVDISLLSIFGSDKDKFSDDVLTRVCNKSDTVPLISESCHIGSCVFSGLASQNSVSIDKTPADTFLSSSSPCLPSDTLHFTRTFHVPSDFINLTLSSDIRRESTEDLLSVAAVCHTSLASSILSRDTTSDFPTMKEKRNKINKKSCDSSSSVVADQSDGGRDNASMPTGLFTSGCHVNPLDDLQAQLSFISGNCGLAENSGYVVSDVYRDHAEASCSWRLGNVGDASNLSVIPRDCSVKQTVLNQTAGKDSSSMVLSDTQEEYDNGGTYDTAETHRGSRLLPRPYHQMPLFRYGQAKASCLWTVPEEPENICDEASCLPVEATTVTNICSDQMTVTSKMLHSTEDSTAPVECNCSKSRSCALNCMSTIPVRENNKEFSTIYNKSVRLSTGSEGMLSTLLEKDYVSFDPKSDRISNRLAEDNGSVQWRNNEIDTSDRFLVSGDENKVGSSSVDQHLDTPRPGYGDFSACSQGRRNEILSDGMHYAPADVCDDQLNESDVDNLSVLDRLSQSLSQFSKQDVGSVYEQTSFFSKDSTCSDEESQICHSSLLSMYRTNVDGSDVSHLSGNDSFSSDLVSNTSSDSIKHIYFSSSGKAEFKEIDDYDNLACPKTIKSDQKKLQAHVNQTGMNSDISVKDFEKIVDELNTSVLHMQEIAESMVPQSISTPECEDLYRAFTNEEAEKQQNHGCIVPDDEDAIKFRFRRFLKKSHGKRKKGLKILKFFSRLGCVSGTSSPPINSPVMMRKLSNESEQPLNAETELSEQTHSSQVLVGSTSCHHSEIHSVSLAGDRSSPTPSNQSFDSVPSKTDSAYSSFSEYTETAANNLGSLSMSNSQVHDSPDHPMKSVNMDSSIISCSSSLDFSSNSSDIGMIQVNAVDSANIRTSTAPKQCALNNAYIISDVFDEFNTCEDDIDTALLYNLRFGHTPAKIDKTWD